MVGSWLSTMEVKSMIFHGIFHGEGEPPGDCTKCDFKGLPDARTKWGPNFGEQLGILDHVTILGDILWEI
jgi:hypothetical protein